MRHQRTNPTQGLGGGDQHERWDSGAQAIMRDPQGFYIAATENRKDGQALVY